MDTLIYTIVRFAPFSETGEFANIGVVLVAPSLNFFDFKLKSRRHARVTQFFGEIHPNVYRHAVRNLTEELLRMRSSTNRAISQLALNFSEDSITNLMLHELTRKKEGVVRFSELRMVVAKDPAVELDRLYRYYVDRDFATPQYVEQIMEREIRSSLKTLGLADDFREARLKDGVYQARFPFVRMHQNSAEDVIKPISLSQERPESIIEHANKWSYAVRRLKRASVIKGKVLFSIKEPEEANSARVDAFREAKNMLERDGDIATLSTSVVDIRNALARM